MPPTAGEVLYVDDDAHALDTFGGTLSAEEAQELAVVLSAPQLALPGLLAFFAGTRVVALSGSRRLAALVRRWTLMPLAWGPLSRAASTPPHLSGDFAALGDAAMHRLTRGTHVADKDKDGSSDKAEPGRGSLLTRGAARVGAAADIAAAAAAPPHPAAAEEWRRGFHALMGPLAYVPVRPSERAHLGSPAGALLGHLLASPAAVLTPAAAIVAAAVHRAEGRDWDSPYVRLLAWVAHLAATFDAFCAEADALLCSSAAAGAPPAQVAVVPGELSVSPLAALRAGWGALRGVVDAALLPALAACAQSAVDAGQAGVAATYHAAIAAAIAGAPTACLLGLAPAADLGQLRAVIAGPRGAAPLRLTSAVGLAISLAGARPSGLAVFAPAALAAISAGYVLNNHWGGAVCALDSAIRVFQRIRPLLCAWMEALRADASPQPSVCDSVLSRAVECCGSLGWRPDDARAAAWLPYAGQREVARVVVGRSVSGEGRGDAHHLVTLAGRGPSMRCTIKGAFEVGSGDFLRVYAGDDALGVPVHECSMRTGMAADFVVPGRVATVHFHHGHGTGALAASWFSASFSSPVDDAALELLSRLAWSSVRERAEPALVAWRAAGKRARDAPALPPALSADAAPPAWFTKRALARCANDSGAACLWLLQHAADLVADTGEGRGCPDLGTYEAHSVSGALRIDLHLATVARADAASSGRTTGDDFRASLGGRLCRRRGVLGRHGLCDGRCQRLRRVTAAPRRQE